MFVHQVFDKTISRYELLACYILSKYIGFFGELYEMWGRVTKNIIIIRHFRKLNQITLGFDFYWFLNNISVYIILFDNTIPQ
jgi:hypothetical protein